MRSSREQRSHCDVEGSPHQSDTEHSLLYLEGLCACYEHKTVTTKSSFHMDPPHTYRGLEICLLTACRSTFKKGNQTQFEEVRTLTQLFLVKGESEMGVGHMFPLKQPTNQSSPSTRPKCFHKNPQYITTEVITSSFHEK